MTLPGVGYDLLQKLGWSDGEGLGKQSEGIVDPICASGTTGKRGLAAEDEQHSEGTAESKRPRLDSEAAKAGTLQQDSLSSHEALPSASSALQAVHERERRVRELTETIGRLTQELHAAKRDLSIAKGVAKKAGVTLDT